MEIKIKTLTPLWTGGIDGTMERVHEASIIGSLRWWYEAIVRGLGKYACEGPGGQKCELTGERLQEFKKSRQNGMDWWTALDQAQTRQDREENRPGICDGCKVFGTTGWQRRFRLEVVDDTRPIWTPGDRMLNVRPPGRNRGWYLPPGRMGTLTLHVDGDGRSLSLLATLFLFLEQWGGIGAKPQLGYGVFEIENREEVQAWAGGWEWKSMGIQDANDTLPDLRRFGFFRHRFSPDLPGWWTRVPGIERVASKVQPLVSRYGTVPVSPALKNEWRFHRWRGSKQDERKIFGALRPDRRRSKVAVSWAYRVEQEWEVRGWAWLSPRRLADRTWNLLTDQAGWKASLRVVGELKTLRLGTREQVVALLEGKDD